MSKIVWKEWKFAKKRPGMACYFYKNLPARWAQNIWKGSSCCRVCRAVTLQIGCLQFESSHFTKHLFTVKWWTDVNRFGIETCKIQKKGKEFQLRKNITRGQQRPKTNNNNNKTTTATTTTANTTITTTTTTTTKLTLIFL